MRPKLYICGLGQFPPQTTSLNVLHSLARCDVVISSDLNESTREILEQFDLGRRRVFIGRKKSENALIRRVLQELGRGLAVGFVTSGHPFLGGPAARLVRRCAQAGIDCEAFGAVSPVGMMMARLNKTLGVDMHGIQSCGSGIFEDSKVLNTLQPLVVFFEKKPLEKKQVDRLGRAMRRSYPPEHYCWMFGVDYGAPPEAFRLGDLARRFPRIESSRILYVPPL